MNKNLRKKSQIDLFKLMKTAVFEKTIENVRKDRNSKFVPNEVRRTQYLVQSYNFFSENLLAIEMRKTKIYINETVYLRLFILEFSKIVICEFWYGFVKQKYCKKAKLYSQKQKIFIKILEKLL